MILLFWVTIRRSNQLNYAPAYIALLLPDCSVPTAAQLCPKLPESAVTGQRSASDLLGPHDDSFYAYSAKLLLFACS